MRIIAGRWRGRRLEGPPDRAIRPTADRVREALFNRLAHQGWLPGWSLEDATVLDAFAGTGALALEALSRGARRAVMIERDRRALALAHTNVARLGAEALIVALAGDATRPPQRPADFGADLLLLDPPYRQGLGPAALQALTVAGWVAPAALAVLEEAADAAPVAPAGWDLLDRRIYGETSLSFFCSVETRVPMST